MNEEQKFLLEKNLGRFDSFINTVNAKAAFLVSFNTFILGAVLLRHDSVLAEFSLPCLSTAVAVLLGLCLISVAYAIAQAFFAVSPFLKRVSTDEAQGTLLFFGSVAQLDLGAYGEKIRNIQGADIVEDLIGQTHVLATGAEYKYGRLKKAITATLVGTISPIFIIAVLKLIDWLSA